MKTDRVYEYLQADPCPHCGTPRVGIDQDDTYSKEPGVLTPDRPATCSFSGYWKQRDGRWAILAVWEYATLHSIHPVRQACTYGDLLEDMPTVCPDCGETLAFEYDDTLHDAGSTAAVGVLYCPATRHRKPGIKHLPSCGQCATMSVWPGFGLSELGEVSNHA